MIVKFDHISYIELRENKEILLQEKGTPVFKEELLRNLDIKKSLMRIPQENHDLYFYEGDYPIEYLFYDEVKKMCIRDRHFTTNKVSYHRVIQFGEQPDRVFNFGSTSIDNILNIAKMDKFEALRSLGLNNCKYAICTYHPVTLDIDSVDGDIENFLCAIRDYPSIQFIVTKANADQGGAHINEILDSAETSVDNLHVYSSLGVVRYLSLMKYAEFVLGNSSSGIVEAPAFGIPTVNIGDRQRGDVYKRQIPNLYERIYLCFFYIHYGLCRQEGDFK